MCLAKGLNFGLHPARCRPHGRAESGRAAAFHGNGQSGGWGRRRWGAHTAGVQGAGNRGVLRVTSIRSHPLRTSLSRYSQRTKQQVPLGNRSSKDFQAVGPTLLKGRGWSHPFGDLPMASPGTRPSQEEKRVDSRLLWTRSVTHFITSVKPPNSCEWAQGLYPFYRGGN